jgi:hypothetical protein
MSCRWMFVLALMAPGSAPAADTPLPAWAKALEPEAAIAGQPEATSIDARMRKVYAAMGSYRDSGTIRKLSGGWPAEPRERTFTTTFTRQGFRFQIQQPEGPAPKQAEVSWNQKDPESAEPGLFGGKPVPAVTQAVVKATQLVGLPGAFHVLMLLLPQTADLGLPRLSKPSEGQILTRVADGVHEGKPCYRLQLLDHMAFQFRRTFWIEKRTFHLLRLDEKGSADLVDGPDVAIDRQIVYRPRFDAPVPAKAAEAGR